MYVSVDFRQGFFIAILIEVKFSKPGLAHTNAWDLGRTMDMGWFTDN